MTAEQRAAFDRDGYLIVRAALGPDETAAARDAIDRVYASAAEAGSLSPDGSMHLLSAVANCPEIVGLIDHPAFFGYTYRWTAVRDDIAPVRASDWFGRLTPVQRQLLGGAADLGGDHAWGHDPATTPLYGWLQ